MHPVRDPERAIVAGTYPRGNPSVHSPVVFIVDADDEARDAVRMLAEAAGLRVQAYSDSTSFLTIVPLDRPGCIVLGTQQGAAGVLDVQRELHLHGVRMPIIVTVTSPDVSTAVSAVKAGALDVIERPLLSHRLVPALLEAMASDLTARANQMVGDDIRLRYERLTKREREVLHFVVMGQPSSAIARQLGIHEKTVEIYRSHIKKKMRARNAVELTKMMHSIGYGG